MDKETWNNYDNLWKNITYVEKYFQLHASQRIALFKLYTIFLTLYLTSSGFLLVRFSFPGFFAELSAIVLSISFLMITFVFHHLDTRNKHLIHLSEDALIELENKINIERDAKIFNKERNDCISCRGSTSIFRHTLCFAIIFYFSYILSFSYIAFSICYLTCC
jgi:hypothetical protein